MRAKTAPEFDRALDCADLADHRPDRPSLRPDGGHRAGAGRWARACWRSGRTTTSRCASARSRREPTGCSPIASSSRTVPPRSGRGWSGSRRRPRPRRDRAGRPPDHPRRPLRRTAAREPPTRPPTHGFDALLVGVGPDLRYLTGYEAMPLERLTMLVVIPGQRPAIVVPRLERGAAEAGLADRGDRSSPGTSARTARPGDRRDRSPARRRRGRRGSPSPTRLWARHLLAPAGGLPRRRFELPRRSCATCG